jgi:hypothetical protein
LKLKQKTGSEMKQRFGSEKREKRSRNNFRLSLLHNKKNLEMNLIKKN